MPKTSRFEPVIGAENEFAQVDRLIATFAGSQHGVVARRQLLRAGIRRRAIGHRLEEKRLHVVHRGVYAVGHLVLTRQGRWMAAVLAAGPNAVLSHRAAGGLHGIRPWDGLEVTVPTYRARPSLIVHTSSLPKDELTTVERIAVTSVPRTLLDLAGLLPAHQVERALNETEVQGLTDPLSLPDLVARYPRRKGIATIKALLDTGPAFTRSELEARFAAFLRNAALPPPSLNAAVEGFECDCVWHDQRVIVELDGHATHGTRAAFERDRARDRALAAAGWQVVRVTWRQLHDEPAALAADLRRILATPSR